MKIAVEKRNDTLYIRFNGELDEHTAATLRRETDELLQSHIDVSSAVFDLTGISFLDSTAIGFLLGRYKSYLRHNVRTYISNPSLSADKILTMSGVYTLMPKI